MECWEEARAKRPLRPKEIREILFMLDREPTCVQCPKPAHWLLSLTHYTEFIRESADQYLASVG